MDKLLIIILGPTASGKTDLSIEIAKHFNADIFSCDSRQFYKQLNIGVAKPSVEQLNAIKHHFIGNVDITEHYSISKFEQDAITKLDEYYKNNNIAIMTGGSGLYINAICNGVDEMPDFDPEIRENLNKQYESEGIESIRFELKKIDPVYYNQVDLKNPQRILRAIEVFKTTGIPFSKFRTNTKANRNFNIIKIGIKTDRELLYERINRRVDIMFENGLLNEVKPLYKYKNHVALKTIGYSELFMYLENKINLERAIELIKRNSRRYARRQITWFKKIEDCSWFETKEIKNIIDYINNKTTNN
jgi:tRNA dimethylallyltransferase